MEDLELQPRTVESVEKTSVVDNHNGTRTRFVQTDVEPLTQPKPSPKKPLAFHMSFLALLIMNFLSAFDATILGVAIPVNEPPRTLARTESRASPSQ